MDQYDVIIIGAGPAGGQCARELCEKNRKVLLTEKAPEFSTNNYSTAGAPQELVEMFTLPDSVIGTTWNKFRLTSPKEEHVWSSPKNGGVIMDFKKLRAFLADEAVKHGGELELGLMYKKHEDLPNGLTRVILKKHGSEEHLSYETKVLVDATGAERKVLHKNEGAPYFEATGLEYLVQVNENQYDRWSHALSVFMGKEWMPQGYSWIFPMEPNKLKIGVGKYFKDEHLMPNEKPYKYYLENILQKCLGTEDVPILERHGKTLHYTYNRDDIHYHNNIIAIGDTISMVNPLGLEGIRHAMINARIASKQIEKYLRGDIKDFHDYPKEVKKYTGIRWRTCEYLMNKVYREPTEKRIQQMLQAWKHFSFDEMIDLAFHYKFTKAVKFLAYYTYYKWFGQ